MKKIEETNESFESKIDFAPEPDEFDLAVRRLVLEGRVVVSEDGVIKLVRN